MDSSSQLESVDIDYDLSQLEISVDVRDLSQSASASDATSSSSPLSSIPPIISRNYYWNELTGQQKNMSKHRCIECSAILSGRHTSGKTCLKGDMKIYNPLHLCTICSVIAFSLLELPMFPSVEQLLNVNYLQRTLTVEYDLDYSHPKVYTCQECLGPVSHLTPFKTCIECISQQWPLMIIKADAVMVLKKCPALLTIPAIRPYLLKRQELSKENRLVKILQRENAASNDPWIYHADYTLDGDAREFHMPYWSTCGVGPEDLAAVQGVRQKRIQVVSESSNELIPDIAAIIGNMEELLPACDARGNVRRQPLPLVLQSSSGSVINLATIRQQKQLQLLEARNAVIAQKAIVDGIINEQRQYVAQKLQSM